jgi:exosortase/archaeosortase family protein
MKFLLDKKFLRFVIKFLLVFAVLYFGTIMIIGLAAPGRYYSPFVAQYLDYVSWIKRSLIKATALILDMFGIQTKAAPGFVLRIVHGRGVIIAMSCVGYGVYSFWIAYVAANTGRLVKKAGWIIAGVLLLWLINVIRITLFLVAVNKGWPMPLGIDHHTWFNIFAYLAIFLMMYSFEKRLNKAQPGTDANKSR